MITSSHIRCLASNHSNRILEALVRKPSGARLSYLLKGTGRFIVRSYPSLTMVKNIVSGCVCVCVSVCVCERVDNSLYILFSPSLVHSTQKRYTHSRRMLQYPRFSMLSLCRRTCAYMYIAPDTLSHYSVAPVTTTSHCCCGAHER